MAVEHRRVGAQAQPVGLAVDPEPLGGVGFMFANLVAHLRVENLRPALDADADDDSFEGLTQNLINSAINDSAADITNETEEATAPLGAPAVPNQQHTRRPTHTQIPLASLFNFTWMDNELDFYWKGAIRNLDADAAACELAFAQQEGLQVPGMSDTSSSSSSLA